MPTPSPARLLGLLCAWALGAGAHAQPVVALAGVLGNKALLVIDRQAPRAVAAGESVQGLRVLRVEGDSAVVEFAGGGRQTLRLGDAPASVRPRVAVEPLVLKADASGHFIHDGQINGQAMRYLVDTGASVVAIDQEMARRLGLTLDPGGANARIETANGVVRGWRVKLQSVQAGSLQLHLVDAVVTPQPLPYVLLGNSFLRAFEMRRLGNELVLQARQ